MRAIEEELSLKAVAAAFSVSPATTLACLRDRSSRPHRFPRELARQLQERICACNRQTGWGSRLVAAVTDCAHSNVWKVPRRAGISRPHGIVAKRLVTDKPSATSRTAHCAGSRRPRDPPPDDPALSAPNCKLERFHQTMAHEWVYGLVYGSHRQRSEALPHWLERYNRRRPHSSIGDRPPISRIHNDCG